MFLLEGVKMKISELIKELKSWSYWTRERTNDTVKTGSVDKEICAVGVTMFPTTSVIKKAKELGVNFLIAHEGIDCVDEKGEMHEVSKEKFRMLENFDITEMRFHDMAHTMDPDVIFEGGVKMLNLKGIMESGNYYGGLYKNNRLILDKPITARELGKVIEKNFNCPHVRIAGELYKEGKIVACCFGAGGNVMLELGHVDFVITGELCEWREAELTKDYAEQGFNKAIIVMGHAGSEYAGMITLGKKIKERHREFPIYYLECGDSYSYTDTPDDCKGFSGIRGDVQAVEL